MSVNSNLKTILIIGQRKAFYRQRIPEYIEQEGQESLIQENIHIQQISNKNLEYS